MTTTRTLACIAILLAATTATAETSMAKALRTRLSREIDSHANASDKVKDFAKKNLLPHCSNPVFLAAAAAQNAKKTPLDEIKRLDSQWIAAEDELPIQAERLHNACAQEIRRVAALLPPIAETFVMDDQGANVGQNALTSDYWQGDEPKWLRAFAEGKGGVDISVNAFDKSTNLVLQRVSMPLIDEEGKVIGAVSFGLIIENM